MNCSSASNRSKLIIASRHQIYNKNGTKITWNFREWFIKNEKNTPYLNKFGFEGLSKEKNMVMLFEVYSNNWRTEMFCVFRWCTEFPINRVSSITHKCTYLNICRHLWRFSKFFYQLEKVHLTFNLFLNKNVWIILYICNVSLSQSSVTYGGSPPTYTTLSSPHAPPQSPVGGNPHLIHHQQTGARPQQMPPMIPPGSAPPGRSPTNSGSPANPETGSEDSDDSVPVSQVNNIIFLLFTGPHK